MQIKTTAQSISFPAFFNERRYDQQAIGKICDVLMEQSAHDCNPNAPLFSSKFKHIESEGASPVHLEVAIFAKVSKSGQPYLSCSIKPATQRSETQAPRNAPKADDQFDDDIPF